MKRGTGESEHRTFLVRGLQRYAFEKASGGVGVNNKPRLAAVGPPLDERLPRSPLHHANESAGQVGD